MNYNQRVLHKGQRVLAIFGSLVMIVMGYLAVTSREIIPILLLSSALGLLIFCFIYGLEIAKRFLK